MTIQESLMAITPYPITAEAIAVIMAKRGLIDTKENSTEDGNTSEPQGGAFSNSLASAIGSREYELATADVYMWLSVAPNISQGGQSYGFNAEEKKRFIAMANSIYNKYGEVESVKGTIYGYKGSRL